MAAPALGFPPRKVPMLVHAYEKESVLNFVQRTLRRSQIPPDSGPAIVFVSNSSSRIIGTSLTIESSDFTELLNRPPTVLVDADPVIAKIEERVEAALKTLMVHNLPLVIVCPPFETGNKCSVPMVDVWAGPEELELVWGQANFEFNVMDIRKTISPMLSKVEVPLVTFLGHYPLAGSDRKGDTIVDSTAWGHIVSNEELLEDFQEYATPRMARLGDGTNVPIVGSGKMKTEALDVPRVEFAPDLKLNFVSVNQLDRDHSLSCCFRNKDFEIKKDDGTVVGAGVRGDNGIYVLQNLHVPEPGMQKRPTTRFMNWKKLSNCKLCLM